MSQSLLPHFLVVSTVVLTSLVCLSRAATTPPEPTTPPGSLDREPNPETTPHVELPPLVVELAEMRIVADRPRPSAHVARTSPKNAATLVPCSDWEELGPVSSVRVGEIPLTRHVQRLCPPH